MYLFILQEALSWEGFQEYRKRYFVAENETEFLLENEKKINLNISDILLNKEYPSQEKANEFLKIIIQENPNLEDVLKLLKAKIKTENNYKMVESILSQRRTTFEEESLTRTLIWNKPTEFFKISDSKVEFLRKFKIVKNSWNEIQENKTSKIENFFSEMIEEFLD